MGLEIKRFEKSKDGLATIGRWFVDGVYECFNLEDTFREPLDGSRPTNPAKVLAWVLSWKIPGKTAIPSGEYDVIIDKSPLFSKRASDRAGFAINIFTPHILGVPAYIGIRVHSGVQPGDTEGCQCPGRIHIAGQSLISESRLAMQSLLPKIEYKLGLERVPPPDPRIQMYLRYWAYDYKQVRTPEHLKLVITNEFEEAAPFGS